MPGYFDYNATTPLRPEAREAALRAMDSCWYNASSLYREGAAAKRLLEDCREACAEMLRCEPEEIIFTSGATEANNQFVQALASGAGNKLLYSGIEHPSFSVPTKYWMRGRASQFPTLDSGIADLSAAESLLGSGAFTHFSLMAANNETGVLQPLEEAARLARKCHVLFHCDAAQWIGKMPSRELAVCDFLTASAHKFGGPKGVGILKAPAGNCAPLICGGPQEQNRRAGTENLPAVAGMVAAWQAAEAEVSADNSLQQRQALRADFEAQLLGEIPEMEIIAPHAPRLWNTVMVFLPDYANVRWLARLSERGFAVSTGSACSRGEGASDVLTSMGVPPEKLGRVLRFSSGWETTAEGWVALAQAMGEVHKELKSNRKRPQIGIDAARASGLMRP